MNEKNSKSSVLQSSELIFRKTTTNELQEIFENLKFFEENVLLNMIK